MKSIHSLLPVLLLSLVMAGSAYSQTVVPSLMNYQAKVTPATGTIGSPDPVNRLVHFKFWKSPTSTDPADLLYSESQTVTVNNGDFSVLIGNGGAIGSEPHVFANAFNSADVHLGITLDFDNNGNVDNDSEITPRQQIVSTAFAMRAKVAESVDAGAITQSMLGANAVSADKLADDAVNASSLANNSVSSIHIVDLSVDTMDLKGGAVTLSKMADNSVGTAQIINGNVTNAKLATNAVSLANMQDNSVGVNQILNSSVTNAKLHPSVGVFSKDGNILTHTVGMIQIVSPATGGYGFRHTNGPNHFRTWVSGTQTNVESIEDMYLVTNNAVRLAVTKGGRIGIGTQAPTRGQVEITGVDGISELLAGYRLIVEDAITTNTNDASFQTSLYCEGTIVAPTFIAHSDERIKTLTGRSNAAQDLKVLQSIEVTDYTYIDKALKGGREYKKVIAQQVEAVYPLAVERSTDIVPDIYQKAEAVDGWVKLATDLKQGERVRLVHTDGDDVHEILEVEKDRFRTELPSEVEQVFVYGREVKDFRYVDYDAIAMLNVSATQELARRQEATSAELVELKTLRKRVAELEAKDLARDAKMASIEKLLVSFDKPAVLTASLLQGAGAE